MKSLLTLWNTSSALLHSPSQSLATISWLLWRQTKRGGRNRLEKCWRGEWKSTVSVKRCYKDTSIGENKRTALNFDVIFTLKSNHPINNLRSRIVNREWFNQEIMRFSNSVLKHSWFNISSSQAYGSSLRIIRNYRNSPSSLGPLHASLGIFKFRFTILVWALKASFMRWRMCSCGSVLTNVRELMSSQLSVGKRCTF